MFQVLHAVMIVALATATFSPSTDITFGFRIIATIYSAYYAYYILNNMPDFGSDKITAKEVFLVTVDLKKTNYKRQTILSYLIYLSFTSPILCLVVCCSNVAQIQSPKKKFHSNLARNFFFYIRE